MTTRPEPPENRRPPLDRDPTTPPRDAYSVVQGRVLDPGTALFVEGVEPRPTVYVGPRLTISKSIDIDAAMDVLGQVAERLGWTVELEPEDRRLEGLKHGLRTVSIKLASDRAAIAPDGWTLLQQTRAQFGVKSVRGVGLDHVVFTSPFDWGHPFNWGQPFDWGHPSGGDSGSPIASYAVAGSGGRQPVAYVGPAPRRCSDQEMSTRRPVVAILDTGCGAHDWLDGVVTTEVDLDGVQIGYHSPATDPEMLGDLTGPLDGVIDPMSGHGTFIAGLVHQACPDAEIVSWRIMPSVGPIVESDWVTALSQIAELIRRGRAGEAGGKLVDVLSLSIGYYHETPQDALFDPTLYDILHDISLQGTLVVCSVGNDATARPNFPAAFAPWSDGNGPVQANPACPPIVSVGALNPNLETDAMFSNAGPWVRAYVPGAAVMSTFPTTFQGGRQSLARSTAFGRARDTIDPDDFRGGFGVWSGTSFSAPLMAGLLARQVQEDLGAGDDVATAISRAWDSVQAHTGIQP